MARRLAADFDLTYAELAALETKGQSPWEKERRIAVERCRQMVEFWRIQPGEIKAARLQAPPVPQTKYRHPMSGESWNGVGPQPDWLRAALLREGYRVDELRVAP